MRHITSIKIQGFQSHADTHISLSPGLNAITGPSDSGKSAILRALAWWAWNITPGGDWVRKGASLTSVEVTLSDGTIITRERRGKRNVYIVHLPDQQPLELYDFGKDVPLEVLRAHGMTPVGFDPDKPTVLNWANQLESPFFLTEGAPMRARILGRLAGVHVIDKALRDTNRDLLAISSETKRQEDEVSRLATHLEAYADLDDQEQRVARTEAIVHQLDGLLRRLDQLTAVRERFMEVNAGLAATRAMLECLAGVHAADTALSQAREAHSRHEQIVVADVRRASLESNLEWTRVDLDRLRHAGGAAEKLSLASAAHRSHTALTIIRRRLQEAALAKQQVAATLERLAGVPEAAGVFDRAVAATQQHHRLTQLTSRNTQIQIEMDHARDRLSRTGGLAMAQELLWRATDITGTLSRLQSAQRILATVTDQSAQVDQTIARARTTERAGEQLTSVSRATDRLTALQASRNKLSEILGSMTKGREYIAGIEVRIQEAAGAYAQALREAGVCPTCLQTIDPATVARITTNMMHK